MSRFTSALLAVCQALAAGWIAHAPLSAAASYPGIGRPATPAEIAAWDIDVRPDFKGLPPGSGSVLKGQDVWEAKCATCHGTFGESNEVFSPLAGGTTTEDIRTGRVRALQEPVARTTLMKVSSISTLWDYINRAMPWNAPKSLSVEEVYATLAYLLHLGDIVPADFVLSDRNIAQVQERLPNRNGKVRYDGLWKLRGKGDVQNVACMKECPIEVGLSSFLPDHARDSHGNLADQYRTVGPARAVNTTRAAAADLPARTPPGPAALFKQHQCGSCHQPDKAFIGPSLADIAARYRGDAGAAARLALKVKNGGSGSWGAVPMPSHASMADSDITLLVQWILGGAK
ncbi:MAG TPA: c-type cytochrome [Usitatibacteraceae bacterium]|nr:c-type cytochrome [Usitatibacteraceae bacterium]